MMNPPTEKIYEMDPYATSFNAKVSHVEGDWVALDRTAFYPGGGGQDPDLGEIAGVRVVEVRYKDGTISHKMPGHHLALGDEVDGCIDGERRLDLMMAHTGEHLLFSALNKLVPDLELVKIAITPSKKSFIIKGNLDLDTVLDAERFVNDVISRSVPTSEETVTREDPKVQEARVKLERIPNDKIRLIRIGEYDLAACAGLHVANTSEIGMLLVEKLTSAKPQGDYEIEFKIGPKAVQKALFLKTVAMKSAEILGSRPEDAVSALENQRAELNAARDSLRYYARIAIAALEPELIGDLPFYHMLVRGIDRKTLSEEATKKVQEGRSVCVLIDVGERITIIIAAGKESPFDASLLLKKCLGSFGGKGGGNKTFATGGVDMGCEADDVMAAAIAAVRETNV